MTTADPGTEAAVTNSGTDQNAILDFVIPQGKTGTTPSPEFLSAYSTPSQPASSGSSLIFDQNGSSSGTAVSHTAGSADITISQPGYYNVSYHGTVSPGTGASFPESVLLFLQQNGSSVPGAAAQQNFENSSQTANLAFSQNINVQTVPTTLNVVTQGGPIQYGSTSISVNRLGDN